MAKKPFIARVWYQPALTEDPNCWQYGWVFRSASKSMANVTLKRVTKRDKKYCYRLEEVLKGDFDYAH